MGIRLQGIKTPGHFLVGTPSDAVEPVEPETPPAYEPPTGFVPTYGFTFDKFPGTDRILLDAGFSAPIGLYGTFSFGPVSETSARNCITFGPNSRAQLFPQDSLTFMYGGAGWTWESWVKTDSSNGYRYLLQLHKSYDPRWAVSLNRVNDQMIVRYFGRNVGWKDITTIPDNEWVHLAMVHEVSSQRMYVNGVRQETHAGGSFSQTDMQGVTVSINGTVDTVHPAPVSYANWNISNFVKYTDDFSPI